MMKPEDLLLMRHELLLVAAALLLLLAALVTDGASLRKNAGRIGVILMLAITIAGFFPVKEGTLFGGMFVMDGLRGLMKNVLNIGTLLVFIQSVQWLRQTEDSSNKSVEFFMLLISTLTGMHYMISAGNLLMFFLGIELATLPIAALAAWEQHNKKSSEAGVKMIMSSAFASGITLFGISILYGTTGTMAFDSLRLSFTGDPLQTLGMLFFFSGLAFKISLVPFHFWTADVYEGAPVNVTSYLSVVSKAAAVFILVLVLYRIFPHVIKDWSKVLYTLAILTMTIGNLFALQQDNLKRFLAFSSIAQAGFILPGILGADQAGMTAVIYFLLIYIFSNLGAFGVVSAVYNATGRENISDLDGFYRTNPRLSLTMLLSLFSLAGIPPVAGFFGKFFLFTAAASKGYYLLVFIAVLNATIALYYYLMVVKAMFINPNPSPLASIESDRYTRIALVICVAGILLTGFASPVYHYIYNFSQGLHP